MVLDFFGRQATEYTWKHLPQSSTRAPASFTTKTNNSSRLKYKWILEYFVGLEGLTKVIHMDDSWLEDDVEQLTSHALLGTL